MTFDSTKCPIADMVFDERIGQYLLSIKVGKYQEFNSFSYTNQRHYHDCYELVFVLNGTGDFEHNQRTYTLTSGDLFIADPHEEHEIHVTPTESMTVFYLFLKITTYSSLSVTSFEEQLITSFLKAHDPFSHKNNELFAYLIFIAHYSSIKKNKKNQWVSRSIVDFVFNCLEKLTQEKPAKSRTITSHNVNIFEKALDYIDQNIEKQITAQLIADAIALSKRTLYTLFRDHLDCTVHAYIKERKIALAKHYLLMGLPITEVAGLVGFNSLSRFSRIFKEFEGTSPRGFIKSHSKNSIGIGRRMTKEQGLID